MTIELLVGDVRDRIREIPDQSVQCIVTSPPYFGLRDYGTATWAGGDPDCDHKQGRNGSGRADGIVDDRAQRNRDGVGSMGGDCRKCGAVRIDNQIGLEPSMSDFIDAMVTVCRDLRRVLRDDGTLWINIGDSYAGTTGGIASLDGHSNRQARMFRKTKRTDTDYVGPRGGGPRDSGGDGGHYVGASLPAKNLMMIPARVAIALQDDGWILRSDIIWHKPNPMPESVTDRPTSAHEHIFLLTKSRRYYYDADAIRTEPTAPTTKMPDGWKTGPGAHGTIHTNGREKGARVDKQRGHGRRHAGFNDRWDAMSKDDQAANGANARNVWTIATHPYRGAHFATFPPELPRRCILAGSKPGDLILYPFAGAGTTLLVADQLGRNAIGIELNPAYAEIARKRIVENAPLFAVVEVTNGGTDGTEIRASQTTFEFSADSRVDPNGSDVRAELHRGGSGSAVDR